MPYYLRHIAVVAALLSGAATAAAQSFEAVGTRAAGMGGAFVAVSDDASAAYWNPAGFASGNYFTIVLDRVVSKTALEVPEGARKGSGLLFALGVPALGLSYYQLRSTSVVPLNTPGAAAGELRVDTLVTHHTGATVLQSIGRGLAAGATLKVVRGVAASQLAGGGTRGQLLDSASELGGRGTTKFDTDLGLMATGALFKAGLTVRNVRRPEFETPTGEVLRLERQARAGIAVVPLEGWVVDADLDLTTTHAPTGNTRDFAAGTEGRIQRRTFVRSGFRLSTTGPTRRAIAAGGSYMVVQSLLVDGQVTRGTSNADRGWSVSARFVY